METISVIQDVSANFGAVDAKGNPVPLPTFSAPPAWSSSDTTVLTVAAAADGMSAVVTAVGKIGAANITVTGTPTGQTAISGSAQVNVGTAAAASLVIGFGTPAIQQPGVPPPPPPPPAV